MTSSKMCNNLPLTGWDPFENVLKNKHLWHPVLESKVHL